MRIPMLVTILFLISGIAPFESNPSEAPPDASASAGEKNAGLQMSPAGVVQEYAVRSSSCGVMAVADLTAMAPDDHMVLLNGGDQSTLVKTIRTPEGMKSDADAKRPVYLNWITDEFPALLCKHEYKFGRILREEATQDRAFITIDFVSPDGVFGFSWTFRLIRTDGKWFIYFLEVPNSERTKPIHYWPKKFDSTFSWYRDITPADEDVKVQIKSNH